MILSFVRHTSVDVPKGVCYGQTDVAVAETFTTEASAVKQKLASSEFNHIFTSPLSRCTRLASFCGYPEAIRDPRLLEMNFGDWEMQRYDAIEDPHIQEWYDDYLNVTPTNGESFRDQQKRLRSFLSELSASYPENSKILIFAHAGIIVQARFLLADIPESSIFTDLPAFGEIVSLNLPKDFS